MDFTTIGNLKSYIKTVDMHRIWKQKDASSAKSGIAGDPSGTQNNWMSGTGNGDQRLSAIVTKIQSGKDLSAEELEYLRSNSPETYEQAIRLAKEKKAYEKELGRCRTKDEARVMQMNKVAEALSQVKGAMARGDVGACVAAGAKMAMLTDAYVKFTASKEFTKLAETVSELNEELKAAQEAVTGGEEGETDVEQDVQDIQDAAQDTPVQTEEPDRTDVKAGETGGENPPRRSYWKE